MKFKSLITTTLALGVIASTGQTLILTKHLPSAKPLDKSSKLHYTMDIPNIQIPYTIHCRRHKPKHFIKLNI